MKNKIIISTTLFIAVLIFLFFALSQEKNKNTSENKIIPENKTVANKTMPVNKTAPNKTVPESEKTIPKNPSENSESQIILFYGDGCPHCALVEKYIKEHNVQDKISLSQKEVYYNQSNAKELEDKAKICSLSTNSIGVPFLWDGKKCLIGDQDIINFFKQKN